MLARRGSRRWFQNVWNNIFSKKKFPCVYPLKVMYISLYCMQNNWKLLSKLEHSINNMWFKLDITFDDCSRYYWFKIVCIFWESFFVCMKFFSIYLLTSKKLIRSKVWINRKKKFKMFSFLEKKEEKWKAIQVSYSLVWHVYSFDINRFLRSSSYFGLSWEKLSHFFLDIFFKHSIWAWIYNLSICPTCSLIIFINIIPNY